MSGNEQKYPAGWFTEPVRAWKQMRFEPQILTDPRTKRLETDFARQERIRKAGGWNTHRMELPGTRT